VPFLLKLVGFAGGAIVPLAWILGVSPEIALGVTIAILSVLLVGYAIVAYEFQGQSQTA
jgi:hypothetical protein